jgi:hypothetical protein
MRPPQLRLSRSFFLPEGSEHLGNDQGASELTVSEDAERELLEA